VPVDDGGRAGRIDEIDAKALAGQERDPGFSVRPKKAEHPRRFAVDGEGSGVGRQPKPGGFGGGSCPRCRHEWDRARHGKTGRKHDAFARP